MNQINYAGAKFGTVKKPERAKSRDIRQDIMAAYAKIPDGKVFNLVELMQSIDREELNMPAALSVEKKYRITVKALKLIYRHRLYNPCLLTDLAASTLEEIGEKA